jgi:hypothetical protein
MTMNPDAQSEWPSPPAGRHTEAVRRQVVDAATEVLRGGNDAKSTDGGPLGFTSDTNAQSALTLYLALLTDRLPVYARAMNDLGSRSGKATVAQNLLPAAQATIDFYSEILAAKVCVFTHPERLLQLRRVLKSHDLGPHAPYEAVAAYLESERRLGRISEDVDCQAVSRLLLGACVNYAFIRMLLGEAQPSSEYINELIGGLRLTA